MIAILSPAKTMDYKTPLRTQTFSMPDFLDRSKELIDILRAYNTDDLRSLMKISEKIATLNHERYQSFDPEFTQDNARQALLAFKGDSYLGFELDAYTEEDFAYAQKHLRMLSGLYGVLRPLDLMQPYRLEMGTKLKNKEGKDLYQFWGKHIAETLNEALAAQDDDILVNLASNEYFKSVAKKHLNAQVIQPIFRDYKGGQHKIIAIYAKKARGAMANYILRNRIEESEGLKEFKVYGYAYDDTLSTETEYVYLRTP